MPDPCNFHERFAGCAARIRVNQPPPRRRGMRLPAFDYSSPGAYFVTICAHEQRCVFGEIVNGGMKSSRIGAVVTACWNEIPAHFPYVELDAFALMPNHLHGLLRFVQAVGVGHARPLQTVIGSFKNAVSRRVSPGIWQRNYWERVVRTEKEASSIREYIEGNALRWAAGRGERGSADLTTFPLRESIKEN